MLLYIYSLLCSICPALMVLVVVGALSFALGLPGWVAYGAGFGIPALYILITMLFYVDMNDPNPQKKKRRQQIQLNWGFYLSGIYSMIMGVVLVGMAIQVSTCYLLCAFVLMLVRVCVNLCCVCN